jgi:hypothetical protein
MQRLINILKNKLDYRTGIAMMGSKMVKDVYTSAAANKDEETILRYKSMLVKLDKKVE